MRKKIIIIDDSAMILKLTKNTLEAYGYEVQTFEDPSDFEPSRLTKPDLILVDVNMPQFFGDDVVAFFSEEWDLKTPIYLFSNIAEDELRKRAQECGAQGYISKNWGLEELVSSIEVILGNQAKQQ